MTKRKVSNPLADLTTWVALLRARDERENEASTEPDEPEQQSAVLDESEE